MNEKLCMYIFDEFMKTKEGAEVFSALNTAIKLIKEAKIPSECMPHQIMEFREIFVTLFLSQLVGDCKERSPKIKGQV